MFRIADRIDFSQIRGPVDRSDNSIIKVGTTQSLLSLLDQRQIHIAFLIESENIRNYRTRIIHKGNFELHSKTGRHSDLLITTEPRPEVDSFLRYLSKKKIEPSKHIQVDSWTLSHRLAEMMNGMCLVPDYFPKGNLQVVRLQSWRFPYKALMVQQKDALLSKLESDLTQAFL